MFASRRWSRRSRANRREHHVVLAVRRGGRGCSVSPRPSMCAIPPRSATSTSVCAPYRRCPYGRCPCRLRHHGWSPGPSRLQLAPLSCPGVLRPLSRPIPIGISIRPAAAGAPVGCAQWLEAGPSAATAPRFPLAGALERTWRGRHPNALPRQGPLDHHVPDRCQPGGPAGEGGRPDGLHPLHPARAQPRHRERDQAGSSMVHWLRYPMGRARQREPRPRR